MLTWCTSGAGKQASASTSIFYGLSRKKDFSSFSSNGDAIRQTCHAPQKNAYDITMN